MRKKFWKIIPIAAMVSILVFSGTAHAALKNTVTKTGTGRGQYESGYIVSSKVTATIREYDTETTIDISGEGSISKSTYYAKVDLSYSYREDKESGIVFKRYIDGSASMNSATHSKFVRLNRTELYSVECRAYTLVGRFPTTVSGDHAYSMVYFTSKSYLQ